MSGITNRFVKGLNEDEISIVRRYFVLNRVLDEKDDQKGRQKALFELLLEYKDEEVDDEFFRKRLDEKMSSDVYRQLKSLLQNKLLDAITNESVKNDNKKKYIDEIDKVTYRLEKKLLQFRILYRKRDSNKMELLSHILSEIIDESKKWELYDILIQALNRKKYLQGIRYGVVEFDKNSAEIEYYESCYKAVLFSVDSYFRLIINKEFTNNVSKKEVYSQIKKVIFKLSKLYSETKSAQVNYYLKLIQLAYYENIKDYKSAETCCLKLIELVIHNKPVYRKERIGYAYSNLSQCEVYLGNYNKAIENAKIAQKYYSKESFNTIVSKELEFHSCFYGEMYSSCHQILKELNSYPLIDTGEFRKAKYSYYQACVYFQEKNYKKAFQECSKTLQILKDKTDWGIIVQIISIMTLIELKDFKATSTAIESLHKHSQRIDKNTSISQRNLLIIKILRAYERNEYVFCDTSPMLTTILNDINNSKSQNCWELFTFELIPFNKWLLVKLTGKN